MLIRWCAAASTPRRCELPDASSSALTASLGLPGSTGDQRATAVPGVPAITEIAEGDRRLEVSFTASTVGPAPLSYEFSTDNGATWRTRSDESGASSPLVITTTSASGELLSNGTTYPVRVRALVDMAPTERATLSLTGTQFTQGNGWGAIVHGGFDQQGRFEGYTVQMDRGFGAQVVVRHWRGGGEAHRPIATSGVAPVTTGVHDVRIEVDGAWLRVLVDDVEVLEVPDLPTAVIESGSSGTIRTDGVFGLRLWSSTDLVVQSASLGLG